MLLTNLFHICHGWVLNIRCSLKSWAIHKWRHTMMDRGYPFLLWQVICVLHFLCMGPFLTSHFQHMSFINLLLQCLNIQSECHFKVPYKSWIWIQFFSTILTNLCLLFILYSICCAVITARLCKLCNMPCSPYNCLKFTAQNCALIMINIKKYFAIPCNRSY